MSLLQAIAPLAGSGFTIAACYAAGALLIRRLGIARYLQRSEQIPLTFVLGASGVHLLMFAVFSLQIAYWPVIVALLITLIALSWQQGVLATGGTSAPLPRALIALLTVCCGVFLVFNFVNAWAPEASPDGSGYHLGLIARYLRARGFERITTNWYAALGGGIEMIFAPAFAIGRHSAAALVHFSFLIALAWSVFAYGRRIGHAWAGGAAAVLIFASPVIAKDATSAYVDTAVATIVFTAFYFLEIWDQARDNRILIAAGLLAGFACAAKYTAFTIVIYAACFIFLRLKRPQPVLLLITSAAVMIAPWLIRNWIWYSNPIAPLGNALFRNPFFYILAEQDWTRRLQTYGLLSLWQLPLEVTVRGAITNGALGPVFLLLPIGLLALRFPAGRRLLAATAFLLVTYPANISTRFLIPAVPFLSLALTLALSRWSSLLAVLVLAHVLLSWPTVVKRYAPSAWRVEHFPWRAALRIEPQDGYLRRVLPEYSIARLIEDHVPAGESVLAMNGTADAYTTREIRVSFQSASNQALADTLEMGWNAGTQPLRAHVFHVPVTQAHRVRVVQTARAQYPEQWNIHELQILHQGKVLPRSTQWRLRAWPNPWDVGFAFDDSPVTRWRSWEVGQPGMFLEVDFGQAQSLDEVRLVTSPDYVLQRYELQVMQSDNNWKTISATPQELVLPEPHQVRRHATRELHLRGVHYLLIRDTDFGADDYAHDPEGWGLEVVASSSGAAIYRTIWK